MSTNNYVFQLITNGSATGNSVWWRGGKGRFSVAGTLTGGGSVSQSILDLTLRRGSLQMTIRRQLVL